MSASLAILAQGERPEVCSPVVWSPIVWTIAGSDPGAGAGIQTDLLTMDDLGCHGCTIISALTAQNSLSVTAVEAVSDTMLRAQIDTLAMDMPPAAIKIGLLTHRQQVALLTEKLAEIKGRTGCKLIYDPVAIASTGQRMSSENMTDALHDLLPLLDLITPNLHEAASLAGMDLQTPADLVQAAERLLQRGVGAVLIKGGHLSLSDRLCLDYFSNGTLSFWLAAPRLETRHGHGTGCTYASAIAALLAQDFVLEDAITLARAYLQQGLAKARSVGKGPGPVAHTGWPEQIAYFPEVILPGSAVATELGLCWPKPIALANNTTQINQQPFAPCPQQLGLYPVVDSVAWLERLLDWGVRTMQLRIKDPAHPELEQQISQAVALGRRYQARLFINDYWQLAIKHQAYGVHLGQEDLEQADLDAIARAGLRLGISTHGYYEIARALTISPSYIALGHIFPTRTKQMPSAPQGLRRLVGYAALLRDKATVAIGGISLERVQSVLDCGVGSVAVVTAITEATDPESVTRALLQQIGVGSEEGRHG